MSNLVNKVKDAVTGGHSSDPNAAHHNTSTTHTGGSGLTGDTYGSHHTGSTGSGLTGGTHSGTTGSSLTGSGHHDTVGPHKSDMANKLDPRIDSDLDGSKTVGGGAGHSSTMGTGSTLGHGSTMGHGTSGHGSTMGHGTSGYSAGAGAGSGMMDTHSADAYGGSHSTHHTGGGFGSTQGHNTSGAGLPGPAPNTAGTHKSDLLNRADPRIDSNLDGSKTVGGAGQGSTMGGTTHSHGTTHSTHNTGAGVGSTHGHGNLTGGNLPGPAPNTAGPHKSDMLNKLDPRVDSNLDGSKTVGGDKTYSGSGHAV